MALLALSISPRPNQPERMFLLAQKHAIRGHLSLQDKPTYKLRLVRFKVGRPFFELRIP